MRLDLVQNEPEISELNMASVALRLSCILAVIVLAILAVTRHAGLAIGFLFGSILSIGSFYGIAFVVPLLFKAGSGIKHKRVLVLIFYLKLPIYALIIYFATTIKWLSMGWLAIGIGVAPLCILLACLYNMLRTQCSEANSVHEFVVKVLPSKVRNAVRLLTNPFVQ